MSSDETSDFAFADGTTAFGDALLNAPALRAWPPSLGEAREILGGQPYEVIERIGHGGMGAVFRVRNLEPGMDRPEAVKIRRPEARDDERFRERFLREIATLAQLRHPGLTTVFRSGESAAGYLWFSMEYLEGKSLADLTAPRQPPLPPERVLDITRQLCTTLQFIHNKGRLHRDLKPANVMVCDDGSVRLLDFGIVRSGADSATHLTRPGENPYTPDFAAPEQKNGGPVDERTDLYGFGRIVNAMIRPDGAAPDHPPRFPQRLLELVDDLLAFDQHDRPASAAAVAEKLDQMEPGTTGFWGKNRSPFRGLEAYQPEHAEIFFGRNAAIRRGEEIVRTTSCSWHGFCLIIGGSGSGKSSLARAGLGPALLRGENSAGEENANITPVICDLSAIRPEDECLLPPLVRCLAAAIDGTGPLALADALRHSGADLAPLLAISSADPPTVRLCLILDQFEHFFRHVLPRSAQTRFLIAINRLARTPGVAVLVTLRSDFYHHCSVHPVLMELKEGHQLDLAAPQPWELAAMLRLGARAASLSFETLPDGRGLDDVLLDHTRQNPQTLPLMSYMLEQLWEHRDKENGLLRVSDYEQLGGFEGSVAAKATETFDRFSEDYPHKPNACLDKLFQLVVEMSDSPSSPALVRRIATGEEMAATDPDVRSLAERFVAARLFVTTGDGDASNHGLTLAHECLLRVWPRAIAWAEHNRDFLRTRSRIAARMKEGSPLLEGDPLLEVASEHLTQMPDGFEAEQRAWIKSALAARDGARRKRTKLLFAVMSAMGILTLAASGLGGWARIKRSEAIRERDRAEQAALRALDASRATECAQANTEKERARVAELLSLVLRSACIKAVEENRPESAMILLADPRNGRLIAGVFAKRQSDGTYSKEDAQIASNELEFEPGSIIKPLVFAIALEKKVLTPETEIFCYEGHYRDEWLEVRDDHPYGTITASQVVERMSNIGSFMMGLRIGRGELVRSLNELLPGCRHGDASNPADFSRMTYGYAIATTPWAVLQAYAAVSPVSELSLFSKSTRAKVDEAMSNLCKLGGANSTIAIPGLPIAGMSGTAKKANKNAKGYNDAMVTSFVGYAPSYSPRYLLFVSVENPRRTDVKRTGGLIAGPIVASLVGLLCQDIDELSLDRQGSNAISYEEVTYLQNQEASNARMLQDGSGRVLVVRDKELILDSLGLSAPLCSAKAPFVNCVGNGDGSLVGGICEDGSAMIRRLPPDDTSFTCTEDENISPYGLVLGKDDERWISVSKSGKTLLRQFPSGKTIAVLYDKAPNGVDICFSPDGELVLGTNRDARNSAIFWNGRSGQRIKELNGHEGVVWKVSFSGDGERAITVSADLTARIWNTHDLQLSSILEGHKGQVYKAACGPRLATASEDGSVRLWGVGGGVIYLGENRTEPNTSSFEVARLSFPGPVLHVGFSPNYKLLATYSANKKLTLWDVADLRKLFTTNCDGGFLENDMFSRDGSRLVVPFEGRYRVFDLTKRKDPTPERTNGFADPKPPEARE